MLINNLDSTVKSESMSCKTTIYWNKYGQVMMMPSTKLRSVDNSGGTLPILNEKLATKAHFEGLFPPSRPTCLFIIKQMKLLWRKHEAAEMEEESGIPR